MNERYIKYQKPYIERLKKKLLNYYGDKCIICGSIEKLQFAHIKPTKLSGRNRGKSKRLLDIQKNLNCYTLTCEKHNKEVEKYE